MSDSVGPHRWQPTRLPHPWDSLGKNTGVSCHFLLQCIKVKTESEVAQLRLTLLDPMDCSPPGSSVHGLFQARVLEWGAIAFSGYLFQRLVIAWIASILTFFLTDRFLVLSRAVILLIKHHTFLPCCCVIWYTYVNHNVGNNLEASWKPLT